MPVNFKFEKHGKLNRLFSTEAVVLNLQLVSPGRSADQQLTEHSPRVPRFFQTV
jgi:hypothetical protein